MPFVLDTNVFSRLLARDQDTIEKLRELLRQNEIFLLCPVVVYEIERGLRAKPAATKKRQRFESHLPSFEYRELDRTVWMQAADLWVECLEAGRPHSDDDLLIAAFAKVHGANIVTRNTKDFEGLGVDLEDWAAA